MGDLHHPVLPGQGATDYERYLRTDELLSLQKTPDEQLHRDELLFQTIHQSAELWLKLACFEIDTAMERLGRDEIWPAVRLLRRASDALDLVNDNTLMLEHLAPADYHVVRNGLGHGSGFDSPGFRNIHERGPKLNEVFQAAMARRGVDVAALHKESSAFEDLFQLAERLMDIDSRVMLWRTLHLRLVERVIGGKVIGTQGTPVEVLGRRLDVRYFPELWEVRNQLTEQAGLTGLAKPTS
ncbi:MAG TPA: tryptophan 2,3-dioxygenase family protein [Vicinamibacterales bacterium]|nr:tryptophan 2,3-dioxygenase family protein [Vicinamibacterales bacterium]